MTAGWMGACSSSLTPSLSRAALCPSPLSYCNDGLGQTKEAFFRSRRFYAAWYGRLFIREPMKADDIKQMKGLNLYALCWAPTKSVVVNKLCVTIAIWSDSSSFSAPLWYLSRLSSNSELLFYWQNNGLLLVAFEIGACRPPISGQLH